MPQKIPRLMSLEELSTEGRGSQFDTRTENGSYEQVQEDLEEFFPDCRKELLKHNNRSTVVHLPERGIVVKGRCFGWRPTGYPLIDDRRYAELLYDAGMEISVTEALSSRLGRFGSPFVPEVGIQYHVQRGSDLHVYTEFEHIKGRPANQIGPFLDEDALVERFISDVAFVSLLRRLGLFALDLRPENQIVDIFGRTRYIDHEHTIPREIAKEMAENKRICGTPAYMAPERLAGRLPIEASIVYSLGVSFIASTMGEHPFIEKGADLQTTVQKVQAGVQREDVVAAFCLRVPEEIAVAVFGTLEKNPEDRIQLSNLVDIARSFGPLYDQPY